MSSIDQDQIALAIKNANGASAAGLLQPTMPDPFVNTGRTYMFPESAQVVNTSLVNVDLGPPQSASSVANFFSDLAGNFVEFIINPGMFAGHMESLNVIFGLTVSTANVQLLPTYMWFDKLEIWFNSTLNNGEVFNNKYELASSVLMGVDKLTLDSWAPYHNADPVTLGGAAALVPGSYEFILSLKSTILSFMRLNPQAIKGDVRLRFYPSAFSQLSLAGVRANVVMNRITLNANVAWLNQADAMARSSFLMNNLTTYPISSWSTFVSPQAYALTAGQPIKFLLQAAPGLVSGLLVYAQQANPTGAQYNTGVNLDTAQFALYDSTNNFIQQRLSGRYLRAFDASVEKKSYVLFGQQTGIDLYPVAWSGRQRGVDTGALDGQLFMSFQGTSLEIIPGVTDAGPYNFYVIIMYHKLAKLSKGFVEVGQ